MFFNLQISEFPGVVQVFPNRIHKLHTTRSWDFLGLRHHSPKNLVTESNMGDGKIIGVIDSGVWPESESFNDEGMSPIPSHWKGTCQHGAHFDDSNCNKKLIGARWFIEGFKHQVNMPINITNDIEFLSPRDKGGHGTHTASTAAGSFVENANYKGLASGVARGGAPLAHVAIYKACWSIGTGGCADADLLKAFDKAIDDGVDILSGIPVVASAGNEGPFSQTIVNTAPWLITVAATTIDRAFPTAITLGNNLHPYGRCSKNLACHIGSLNATLAAGKVVLCFLNSDEQNMIYAAVAVHQAGGIGLIYAHYDDNLLESCDVFPCVRVDYEAGTQILSYIRKARHPTVKLSFPKTVIGESAAPRAAYFSARGPSSVSPGVLKPDVAAPGVSILAAYPPLDKDHRAGYALLSGTSMACPHVSGIVALIKSEHPNWSPAAIRSTLVTTASQKGTDGMDITEVGTTLKAADPFDIGGGHVNPNRAVNPGLIYNISTEDYIRFLCAMGYSNLSVTRLTQKTTRCTKNSHFIQNLNLPSITIHNFKKTARVSRVVTNVGDMNSTYKALVQAPYGVQMVIEPQLLHFNSTTRVLSFKVNFFSTQKMHGGYRFGSLTWTDGKHIVRSPVSVRMM
ncbi:subtilase family protein [Actinidia rufa]|uniref:Subtilase family protein n=1 Tax=Actinidia rufa TaxID=165716 RepID=A0A7J0DEF0_9ERIC|nr:subtilase family protein [Actinidia rufa]